MAGPRLKCFGAFSPSVAFGVGQLSTVGRSDAPPCRLGKSGPPRIASCKLGVDQPVVDREDEEPRALVRETKVRRAVEAERTLETKAGQVSSNLVGAQGEVAADVFEEEGPGAGLDADAPDDGPQVAGIGRAAPLAGEAEGLAGVSRNDEIHDATPISACEGSGI